MNLTSLNYKLKLSNEEDNINLFYEVIEDNPSILDIIDSKPFAETPLHIAASRGHIQLATEIMNLKPSFASKLNLQLLSPIHLAMQQDQNRMVLCLVDMNKDIVRIKGKGGLTPLHFVSRGGDVEHLAKFLDACPDSIEDLTVKGETALHIAVKNNNYKALRLLVCFVTKNFNRGASMLKYKVLNQKDVDGNTILHILAQRNFEPQVANALGWLLYARIKLNTKNLEDQTALDMALNVDIKHILLNAGARLGSQDQNDLTLAQTLGLGTTIIDRIVIFISIIRRSISEEERNTWLIVATLVATSAYQSVLSPPGGLYQVSAGDNNVNTTSSNSTTISTPLNAGKSILPQSDFFMFSVTNMSSLFLSTIAIFILTPGGIAGPLVSISVGLFAICYSFSMSHISPTFVNNLIVSIISIPIVSAVVINFISLLWKMITTYKIRDRLYQ